MDLEAIKRGIFAAVKGRARKLLEDSAEARAFLEARAKDLAKLAVRLAQASDEEEIEEIKEEIEIARQAAENEVASIALDAEAAAREAFKEAIGAVFAFVKEALPAIIALL